MKLRGLTLVIALMANVKRPPWSLGQDTVPMLAALLVPLAGWVWVASSPSRLDYVMREAGGVYRTYAVGAPLYLGLLAVTLAWEWARPVERGASEWRGIREDLLWVVAKPCLDGAVATTVVTAALWFHYRVLRGTTVGISKGWPTPMRVAVAFVAADFLLYVTHVARHRIPVLWRFHAVHHSQTRLNFFTEDRNHPLDVLFTRLPIVVIMRLLGVAAPLGFLVGMATWWHGRFIHANVRCRLGPLRAIFVTPQSHRVHHSREMVHRDTNFGTHLVLWDRLFGTHHPDDRVYPPTGIAEDDVDPARSSLRSFHRELLRPFT